MKFEQLLRALLSGVYRMTSEQIDALLSAEGATEEAAEAAILERDRTRIADLTKAKPGQTFQDGYKKAKAEERTAFETEIKTHLGIESDATGLDLLDAVLAAKAKPADMTEDAIKATPTYQAMERTFKKSVTDKEAEWTQKWAERESALAREQNFGKVEKFALEQLNTLNPVMPTSATVASNYQNLFLSALKGYDYTVEGDDVANAVVMKDGKVVVDAHGYSVKVADIVKNTAPNYFEFKANNGGQNGGNGGAGQGGTGTGANGGVGAAGYPEGINKPKSFEEYSKLLSDRSIPLETRGLIRSAYEAEQAGGTQQ